MLTQILIDQVGDPATMTDIKWMWAIDTEGRLWRRRLGSAGWGEWEESPRPEVTS